MYRDNVLSHLPVSCGSIAEQDPDTLRLIGDDGPVQGGESSSSSGCVVSSSSQKHCSFTSFVIPRPGGHNTVIEMKLLR